VRREAWSARSFADQEGWNPMHPSNPIFLRGLRGIRAGAANSSRWITVVGAFALVVAVLGVTVLLDVRYQRAVAQDFLSTGVQTVTNQVEIDVDTGRGGRYIDTVDVELPVLSGSRHATLTNILGDPEGNEVGLHAPDAGTRYAAPLTILYKPEDPSQVIALTDAEEFATDTETPAVASAMVSVAGTTALGAAVSLILHARLRGHRWGSRQAGRRRRD